MIKSDVEEPFEDLRIRAHTIAHQPVVHTMASQQYLAGPGFSLRLVVDLWNVDGQSVGRFCSPKNATKTNWDKVYLRQSDHTTPLEWYLDLCDGREIVAIAV